MSHAPGHVVSAEMPIPKTRSTRGLTSQLTWPQPTMSSSQTKIPQDFQTSGLKSSRGVLSYCFVVFCRTLTALTIFDLFCGPKSAWIVHLSG